MKILIFMVFALMPFASRAEEVMQKKTFTDQLINDLPSVLCSNRTIKDCFINNNEQCSQEMKTSIITCLKTAGPTYTELVNKVQATQWIRELSACATLDFATRLATQKKPLPQCK